VARWIVIQTLVELGSVDDDVGGDVLLRRMPDKRVSWVIWMSIECLKATKLTAGAGAPETSSAPLRLPCELRKCQTS